MGTATELRSYPDPCGKLEISGTNAPKVKTPIISHDSGTVLDKGPIVESARITVAARLMRRGSFKSHEKACTQKITRAHCLAY